MRKLENNPTWTPVVALALRGDCGRWLMHRRPANKHHGGLWEFPGGKVEKGETPAFALVREIKEELAITIREGDLLPVCFAQEPSSAGRAPIVILLYTATRWQGDPKAVEGGKIAWYTPEDITALAKPPLDVELSAGLFSLSGL